MSSTPTPPRQVVFDATPEIFATDTAGSFTYPLLVAGKAKTLRDGVALAAESIDSAHR